MSGNKTIKCGLCHYEFDYGVRVCQGCQGTVVYGATGEEQSEAAKIGATMWGGGILFLLYALPLILNSQFSWSISSGWGLGIWGLAIAAAAGIWGAMRGSANAQASQQGSVRTFRRL